MCSGLDCGVGVSLCLGCGAGMCSNLDCGVGVETGLETDLETGLGSTVVLSFSIARQIPQKKGSWKHGPAGVALSDCH